jgi:thioredoxin reductase
MTYNGSQQTERDVHDITIIGAGPTGLFATFYAGLRHMKTRLIEALPEVGGQLAVLYPEKFIYDVPGFPKILAKDLVKELAEQAFQFQPTVHLDERVENLEHLPVENGDRPLIRLTTNRGDHYSRSVLISAGIGAFAPNKLGAPGLDRFEGRGVYYFVKDKVPFRGKRLLVIGGGDSAVDWCLNMKNWASSILLIHRRDVFRAHEGSVAELFASGIPIRLFWELAEVVGDDHIEGATIFSNKTGEKEFMPIDAVLVNIGFKADLGPVKDWGLKIDKRAVVVNGRMETNLPGVYAAGDVCTQPDAVTLNLIATGFAHAAIAVNCAKTYIDPDSKVFPGHSSEMKL